MELIEWITRLENESIIILMEDLKDGDSEQTPSEIFALLNRSNEAEHNELSEHTSTWDLVSNS